MDPRGDMGDSEQQAENGRMDEMSVRLVDDGADLGEASFNIPTSFNIYNVLPKSWSLFGQAKNFTFKKW